MNVTFYGGVREVTGSMHMVSTDNDRILLDCGLFQGRRQDAGEKNRVMPFDPAILTNMVLSHAHIDHSGRIPLLVKKNFNGQIVTTRATQDVCGYLLPDSAHIQESDADYLNYKTARTALRTHGKKGLADDLTNRESSYIKKLLKEGNNRLNRQTILELGNQYGLKQVDPLYKEEDARLALGFFSGVPYRTPHYHRGRHDLHFLRGRSYPWVRHHYCEVWERCGTQNHLFHRGSGKIWDAHFKRSLHRLQ